MIFAASTFRTNLFRLDKGTRRIRYRLLSDPLCTECLGNLGGCHALGVLSYGLENGCLDETSGMPIASRPSCNLGGGGSSAEIGSNAAKPLVYFLDLRL